MEKHCGSEKRFGKEGNGTDAGSASLESFIKASDKKAHSFAYSLCGNSEEAKELVQEAFYRVARTWDKYDASKPLESWFFSIMKYAFIDSRKRAERQLGVSLDKPLDDEDGSCLGTSSGATRRT